MAAYNDYAEAGLDGAEGTDVAPLEGAYDHHECYFGNLEYIEQMASRS